MVRRVTGRSLGTYLHDEIAGPLGAEFFVGLPASEEHRVARLVSFLESLEAGGSLQDLSCRRRIRSPAWTGLAGRRGGRELPGS